MKVLFINVDSGYGGSTGRIVNDLYGEVVKSGGEAMILYGREFDPNAGVNAVRIGSDLGIYTHALLSRITDRTAFFSKRATVKAIREIEKFNPDIIHLHNLHGYYINIKILFDYLRTCGKPVVWTLHDCWAFTGHCSHYDYIGCDKWLAGCSCCPQKRAYPRSDIADSSQRNYRDKKNIFCSVPGMVLVTPSVWLMDEVKKSFLKEYDTRAIYNGLDLDVFRHVQSKIREKYHLENKFIVLGIASIWSERKGYSDFLRLAKLTGNDTAIVMIGLDKRQIDMLPANCIGISCTENRDELVAWYSTADIYFNSSYEETMGMTTLEALACGTGVVCYDATAIPEIVDENCGAVVQCGDIEAVYKTVCAVKEGTVKFSGMTERAADFEKKDQYRKYTDLYGEMIK